MKKYIFLLFAIFMPLPVLSNISLSPFFLKFDAEAKTRTGQVRFTNTSRETRTYNIRLVNFIQEKDGSYRTITKPLEGNPFADYYLEYSPRQVTLEPMKSQVVRVQRRGMAAADPGEYVSHLLIQEVPIDRPKSNEKPTEGISINLEVVYGVSIPVIIEKGKTTSTARIKNAQVLKNENIARVKVERFGNRSFLGSVVIKEKGREIGKISDFRIFMTTGARILSVPLSKNPKGEISVTLINGRTKEIIEIKDI
ncbi:MAG: hypothetical protein FWD33_01605 [Alphaproteobacteria bacterium]|nr:hypothetical protein [Alphaproteobacteria bacterium]